MDCLQLKYRLFSEQNAERTLFVRVYKLVDDEEKADRVLEVLNVPFFVEESDLKSLFKSENVQIKFTVVKATSDKLRSKTALVEFASKKELKNELRLIKYSDESEKLFLYKTKVFRMNFDWFLIRLSVQSSSPITNHSSPPHRTNSKRPPLETAARRCCPSAS